MREALRPSLPSPHASGGGRSSATQILPKPEDFSSSFDRLAFVGSVLYQLEKAERKVAMKAAADKNLPPPACRETSSSHCTVPEPWSWKKEHALLGGTRPVLLGKKLIEVSDTDKHQSRLLMPRTICELIYKQVNESEQQRINSANGLPIQVLDRKGQHHNMVCKFRQSHKGMVFNGGWNEFVRLNSVELNEELKIKSFRSDDGAIWFALLPPKNKSKPIATPPVPN